MPSGAGYGWSDALIELRSRGFLGLSDQRIAYFFKQGMERALAPQSTWTFLQSANPAYVPGEALYVALPEDVPGATLQFASAVSAVRTGDGRRLPHRSRRWLQAAGYDLSQTGPAAAWYVTRTSFGQTAVMTHPVDSTPLSVDFFMTADEENWELIPQEFWGLILDCAEREAAKDAKDWETVQGLASEISQRQGELLELYYDQQVSNDEFVIANYDD